MYTKLHWYRCWVRFQSEIVMIFITRYLTNWRVNGGCQRSWCEWSRKIGSWWLHVCTLHVKMSPRFGRRSPVWNIVNRLPADDYRSRCPTRCHRLIWVTGDAAVCWENAQNVRPRALEALCLQWWVSFQWRYMGFGASHFTVMMNAILQTSFSNTYSRMKIFIFNLHQMRCLWFELTRIPSWLV